MYDMVTSKYRKQLLIWLALLLAQSLLFPFILMIVVPVVCNGGPGGCGGAVAVVIGMFLKPILVLIPLAGLIATVFRRCFTLTFGLPWTIAALIGVASSGSFFYTFGNFWGANFAAGYMGMMFSPTVLMTFALISFLAASWQHEEWAESTDAKVPWIVAACAAGHAAFLNLPMLIMGIPFIGPLLFLPIAPIFRLIAPMYGPLSLWMPQLVSYVDAVVFSGSLVYIYFLSSNDSGAATNFAENTPVAPALRNPTGNNPKVFGKR